MGSARFKTLQSNSNSQETKNIQLVLYDTPGVLGFRNASKDKMNAGWSAAEEADTVVLVVDCLRRIDQE